MRQLLRRLVSLAPQSLMSLDFRTTAEGVAMLATIRACAGDSPHVASVLLRAASMHADVNARCARSGVRAEKEQGSGPLNPEPDAEAWGAHLEACIAYGACGGNPHVPCT